MLKDTVVRFDTTATHFVQRWPTALRSPMLTITTVGQPAVLAVAATIVSLIAWQQNKFNIAFGLITALLALGINMVVRHYIHRPRPDTLYVSNMFFKTSSFPSGHAFGAVALCGQFAYLALHYLPGPWHIITPVGLGISIVLIGISRIYLGAHYPTDVIAGWLFGGLTLWLIIIGLSL